MTIQVVRSLGTPAGKGFDLQRTAPSSLDVVNLEFQWAWDNRIGLLYLLSIQEGLLSKNLIEKRASLIERQAETTSVMRRVCTLLNKIDIPYVIFKTVRPFPFTPNDIDVLFLGNAGDYKHAVDFLAEKGYGKLGVAPLQVLVYDPTGEGKVGLKKEGGIYYLDLYKYAGADHIRYLDPRRATTQIKYLDIDGVSVPVLTPEMELGVMLFHNVFPENTYHIEHFYLILHYLYDGWELDVSEFIRQVRNNHFASSVRANFTVTAILHEIAFGFTPEKVRRVLDELGGQDRKLAQRFAISQYKTPYYFRSTLFVGAIFTKLVEWNTFISFIIQFMHMINPEYAKSTIKALFTRIKGLGVYEQT